MSPHASDESERAMWQSDGAIDRMHDRWIDQMADDSYRGPGPGDEWDEEYDDDGSHDASAESEPAMAEKQPTELTARLVRALHATEEADAHLNDAYAHMQGEMAKLSPRERERIGDALDGLTRAATRVRQVLQAILTPHAGEGAGEGDERN